MQHVRELISSSRSTVLVLSATALGATVGYRWWLKSKLRINGEFSNVGLVAKIFIYPIKSLPGIEVDNAYITESGLHYNEFRDRSFVLQKEGSGMVITMRQEPTLALLKVSFGKQCLYIDGPEMDTLMIPLKTSVEKGDIIRTCRLYGQDIKGILCSDEVNQWFQKFLGKPGFLLLQFVPSFEPRTILNNLMSIIKPGKMVYHDDCSYLIISEASIEDLNSRLKEKVSYKNFRPNFLLSGCKAYAEDNMKFATVGEGNLMFMTHCPRCILTTVNPETGVRTDKEPLTTLKTYRCTTSESLKKQYENAPLFGIYMGVRKEGAVHVNDTVSAISFEDTKYKAVV